MAPISLDGEPSSQPVLNPLHQACEVRKGLKYITKGKFTHFVVLFVFQDGNLQILEEVLNSREVTDLNELSNTLVPQAPLFIAFKNDHFQVSTLLLRI